MEAFDYDLFISHASEDKAGFVRELVGSLERRGLKVWFDDAELQVGDTLTRSIDDGLRQSRFGVVILSRAFFDKNWPRAELDALASREIESGEVVVLPVWLDVDADDVRQYSPLLARKLALRSQDGIEAVTGKLELRVRGTSTSQSVRSAPRSLQPEVLRGRVIPHTYSPIVQGDEHALISRVALAARVPTAPEPTLRSPTHQLFENAVANSSLESFLHSLTSPLPRPHPEHFWRLVDPTKSGIVTAARPVARMIVDGWTAEAKCAISLKPQPSVVPLDWLILHVDVAIRPVAAVPTPGEEEWKPLSLDDLFALLFVPLTAALDEIAPAVLPAITGDVAELLAAGCLLLPIGDPFNRYIRLSLYADKPRIEGASGPYAVDWYPSEMDEIASREARVSSIRDQLERLFTDGGYRGFEHALEQLAAPVVRPTAST